MELSYWLGLDLGQTTDPTALAILEQSWREDSWHYGVRYLSRYPLGTRYPAIVSSLKDLVSRPQLRGETLVVDQTGVGRAVCDMLVEADLPVDLQLVTITGGHRSSRMDDGSYHVPKKDLVASLQVLFQSRRLRIAKALPLAPVLVNELEGFRVKVTASANEVFSAREGVHDDLLLAVAVAAWAAERPRPKPYRIEGPLVLNFPRKPDLGHFSEDEPLDFGGPMVPAHRFRDLLGGGN